MNQECGHGLERLQFPSFHGLFRETQVQEASRYLVANAFQQVYFFRRIAEPSHTIFKDNHSKPVFSTDQRNINWTTTGAELAATLFREISCPLFLYSAEVEWPQEFG